MVRSRCTRGRRGTWRKSCLWWWFTTYVPLPIRAPQVAAQWETRWQLYWDGWIMTHILRWLNHDKYIKMVESWMWCAKLFVIALHIVVKGNKCLFPANLSASSIMSCCKLSIPTCFLTGKGLLYLLKWKNLSQPTCDQNGNQFETIERLSFKLN